MFHVNKSLVTLLGVLAIVSLLAVTTVSADSDPSSYHDCESCVENGWGWSWSKHLCGGYLNTNCDPDSAEALDEEEDDDYALQQQRKQAAQPPPVPEEPIVIPDPAPIPSEPLPWANTESTTHLWQLCNSGDLNSLQQWVYRQPELVHLRSEDGRGPLFWAYEYQKWDMVDFLISFNADENATDADGKVPKDMLPRGASRPKQAKQPANAQPAKPAANQQANQQPKADAKKKKQAKRRKN